MRGLLFVCSILVVATAAMADSQTILNQYPWGVNHDGEPWAPAELYETALRARQTGTPDDVIRLLAPYIVTGPPVIPKDTNVPGELITGMGEPAMVATFRNLRESNSPRRYAWLAAMFGHVAAPEARKLLEHERAEVRAAGADILADVGTDKDVPLLMRLVEKDESSQVHMAATKSLITLGDPRAWSVIEPMLESEQADEREAAIEAAARLQPKGARDILEAALQDPVYFVRSEAALALGKLGNGHTIEVLREFAMYEPNRWAASAALHSLRELPPPDVLPALVDIGKYWSTRADREQMPVVYLASALDAMPDHQGALDGLEELLECYQGTKFEEYIAASIKTVHRKLEEQPPPSGEEEAPRADTTGEHKDGSP